MLLPCVSVLLRHKNVAPLFRRHNNVPHEILLFVKRNNEWSPLFVSHNEYKPLMGVQDKTSPLI